MDVLVTILLAALFISVIAFAILSIAIAIDIFKNKF